MEGFYRGDFGEVGFLRGFWVVNEREAGGLTFVGAAICRFFLLLYELTSQRIWNFSIFTVAAIAFVVVVNVCSSHIHWKKVFFFFGRGFLGGAQKHPTS